jgi:hypothetical protein
MRINRLIHELVDLNQESLQLRSGPMDLLDSM